MVKVMNNSNFIGMLIRGMRDTYFTGGNAMEYAREYLSKNRGTAENMIAATLIAYDLQAGTYTENARKNYEFIDVWCTQLAELINRVMPNKGTVLEIGCGEATTLAGVKAKLGEKVSKAYGFDLSWSRIDEGCRWMGESNEEAELFVGDIFEIPMADNSVDVVYSSHSLEPNGGKEEMAIKECMRVARNGVVLVEPIYELVDAESRKRMEKHGYIRGLRSTVERLGSNILDYRILEHYSNPLNPSGVVMFESHSNFEIVRDENIWSCPLTGSPLVRKEDLFLAPEVGIAYPVLKGVPMLRSDHAIVASGLSNRY